MNKPTVYIVAVLFVGALAFALWPRDPKARVASLWDEYMTVDREFVDADTAVARTYGAAGKETSRRLPRSILDDYDRAITALEHMTRLHVEIEETLDDARGDPEFEHWLKEQDEKVAGGTPHLRKMLADFRKGRRSAVVMMEISEKQERYAGQAKTFYSLQNSYFRNRNDVALIARILEHLEGMVQLSQELVELSKEHKHPGVHRSFLEERDRIRTRLAETRAIADRLRD